jgi:flagellin-like protein
MNKKAEAGLGTLILFIALILVAAVAAGVLIQTSGSLQSQALSTGSQAETQVSTKVDQYYVWAEDGRDGSIELVYMRTRLSSGSDPIAWNQTAIAFDTDANRVNLVYNRTANCSAAPTYAGFPRAGQFAVQNKIGANITGYLNNGDVAVVCFNMTTSLDTNRWMKTTMSPRGGQISAWSATTPEVITDLQLTLIG